MSKVNNNNKHKGNIKIGYVYFELCLDNNHSFEN